MARKIALVTGASAGIGRAITKLLADNGYYVFASARRMDRLEMLRSDSIEPLQFDVTDFDMVNTAISHIHSSKGRVDVLVNNAGYGVYGTVEGLNLDQVRRQFDVNVFSLINLMQSVLPMMREQQAGCIVNITSVVGKVSFPSAGCYSASKHAVEALSDALRLEVKQFGIKVVIVEPGVIKTDFYDVAMDILDQSNDPDVYESLKHKFRKLIKNMINKAPGPDIIARTVFKAVKSSNPRPRYATPFDSKSFIYTRRIFGDRILDWIISRQLKE